MKKVQLLLLVFFCSFAASQAQDIHFSQFYLSPLNLNPALTGLMNCNKRLVGNYRSQWASVLRDKAYSTFSASYDQKIPVGRYDYFGIGGTLWRDKAGSLEFGSMQARLSFSYSKKMGGYRKKSNYLVIGADAGVTQRSIDFTNAQWGAQNDNGVFNPAFNSLETTFNRDNFVFADMAAGLLWFFVNGDQSNYYLGGAYHHINRANQSFVQNNLEPLYSRFTIHGGGEFKTSDRFGLVPGAIVMLQGPSMEINAGTSFKYFLGTNKALQQAVQFGIWGRYAHKLETENHFDAIVLSTRFDYDQFSIGFSYDVNVSSLTPASNSNGAFEFSIVYKLCGPETRKVYCPNF